jgi:hypothetical protein
MLLRKLRKWHLLSPQVSAFKGSTPYLLQSKLLSSGTSDDGSGYSSSSDEEDNSTIQSPSSSASHLAATFSFASAGLASFNALKSTQNTAADLETSLTQADALRQHLMREIQQDGYPSDDDQTTTDFDVEDANNSGYRHLQNPFSSPLDTQLNRRPSLHNLPIDAFLSLSAQTVLGLIRPALEQQQQQQQSTSAAEREEQEELMYKQLEAYVEKIVDDTIASSEQSLSRDEVAYEIWKKVHLDLLHIFMAAHSDKDATSLSHLHDGAPKPHSDDADAAKQYEQYWNMVKTSLGKSRSDRMKVNTEKWWTTLPPSQKLEILADFMSNGREVNPVVNTAPPGRLPWEVLRVEEAKAAVHWSVDFTEGKAVDPWRNADLSSEVKTDMYELHKANSKVWTVGALAKRYRVRSHRVMAVLKLKEIEEQRRATGQVTDNAKKFGHLMEKVVLNSRESVGSGEQHYAIIPSFPNFKTVDPGVVLEKLEAKFGADGTNIHTIDPAKAITPALARELLGVPSRQSVEARMTAKQEVHSMDVFRERLQYNVGDIVPGLTRVSRKRGGIAKKPDGGWSFVVTPLDSGGKKKNTDSCSEPYVAGPDGSKRELTDEERFVWEKKFNRPLNNKEE